MKQKRTEITETFKRNNQILKRKGNNLVNNLVCVKSAFNTHLIAPDQQTAKTSVFIEVLILADGK